MGKQGRVLMWDVDGREGWVDGKIAGYCRNYDGFRGKITGVDFGCTADGAHTSCPCGKLSLV